MDRSAELYIGILGENKRNLLAQIAMNEQLLSDSKLFADKISVNIASLKAEVEEIDRKIQNISENKEVYGKTEYLEDKDELYNDEKQDAIAMSNEIRDLRAKANEISSNKVKRKYYKIIEQKEDKLRKMTGRMAKIDKKQRRALLKKNKKEMFKQKMVVKERTKAAYYQELANDYKQLKETSKDESFGFIKEAIYENKAKKSYKKAKNAAEVSKALQRKNTCYVGSRNMTSAKLKCRKMASDIEMRIMCGGLQPAPLTR